MKKATRPELDAMVHELLDIKPLYERYLLLEERIKAGMAALRVKEIEDELGRVSLVETKRVTVSPHLAADILGERLAERVILTEKRVLNVLIKAHFEAGEISKTQRDSLLKNAKKVTVINLKIENRDSNNGSNE